MCACSTGGGDDQSFWETPAFTFGETETVNDETTTTTTTATTQVTWGHIFIFLFALGLGLYFLKNFVVKK